MKVKINLEAEPSDLYHELSSFHVAGFYRTILKSIVVTRVNDHLKRKITMYVCNKEFFEIAKAVVNEVFLVFLQSCNGVPGIYTNTNVDIIYIHYTGLNLSNIC
jgi:hypothetical protein